MDADYLKIFVTVVLAVAGWITAHKFTSKRDIESKRREVSLGYLVDSYRTLTIDISHRPPTDERGAKLEVLLSDLQLFGTPTQVNMAKSLAERLVAGRDVDLDPLINDLRNDLRKQLGLKAVSGNVQWIRFRNVNDRDDS